MSEGTTGSAKKWAAGGSGGKAMLPGFNPRPEYLIHNKSDTTENVDSTSKALFVHAKNSNDVEINVNGKVGKIIIERCSAVRLTVSDNVIGGTVEIINCKTVSIHYLENAVVPVIQVDDSSDINVSIQKKEQIEAICFVRCNDIKLFLENQTVNGESEQTLQYEVATEEVLDVQRIGHWAEASLDADFITKNFIRTSLYPTVTQMKVAASATNS